MKYVEENAAIYLSSVQQTNIDPAACDPVAGPCATTVDNRLWHLDRTDQNTATPNNEFRYCTDGTGVTVYVVDSGVNKFHQEFAPGGARVRAGYNASGDGMPADDPCLGFAISPSDPDAEIEAEEAQRFYQEILVAGHGTTVASVLGGRRVGVAKNVTIVPVKVIRCDRYSARQRVPNQYYQMNETMFIMTPDRSGTGGVWRATTSGYTGGPVTTWPTTNTVQDNEVIWQSVPLNAYSGSPTVAMLIDGLEWILSPSNPGPRSHAVVTLSMFKRKNIADVGADSNDDGRTLETAIRSLIASNMTVIASANNQNGDACDTSPGRLSIENPDSAVASDVITAGGSMLINRPWTVTLTGAPAAAVEADGPRPAPELPYGKEPHYDRTKAVRDGRWICGAGDSSEICSNLTATSTADPTQSTYGNFQGGSNGGPCVTLFAPAKNIAGATPASGSSYRDPRIRGGHASGTSWSAPIVAGFAARLLQNQPTLTPSQVRAALLANSEAALDTATLNPHAYDSPGTGTEIGGSPNKLLRLGDVNITQHPASTPAAVSGPTTLVVQASGTSVPLTYQWYEVNSDFDYAADRSGAFSSAPIGGATAATFAAPAADAPRAYWVRVTNSCASADSTIAVVVPRPSAPTNVSATLAGSTARIAWNAGAGAERYHVQRKIAGQPWTTIGDVPSSTLSLNDAVPINSGVAVYRVLAAAGASYLPPGNLATAFGNNDCVNLDASSYEPLATPPSHAGIKAQHVIDLRKTVNAACAAVGAPLLYAPEQLLVSSLQGTSVKAADFTSLLTSINAIRTHSLLSVGVFSPFTSEPTAGAAIGRVHLQHLRNALQ